MKIFVVIPAYNPDDKMLKLINDIYHNELFTNKYCCEIVIVNDGSDKNCDDLFKKAKLCGAKILEQQSVMLNRDITF